MSLHRSIASTNRLTVVDVLEGQSFVAALRLVDAARPGQPSLHNRTVHLARVEAGRIAEIWFHNLDQHTVDAFWGTRQWPRESAMLAIARHIKAIMLVSGMLTSTMFI